MVRSKFDRFHLFPNPPINFSGCPLYGQSTAFSHLIFQNIERMIFMAKKDSKVDNGGFHLIDFEIFIRKIVLNLQKNDF